MSNELKESFLRERGWFRHGDGWTHNELQKTVALSKALTIQSEWDIQWKEEYRQREENK